MRVQTYSALSLVDLRKVRGYSFSKLSRGRSKLPQTPGIYIWRYWPSLADLDEDSFIQMIRNWRETHPQFEEVVQNSRMTIRVKRTPFGSSATDGDFLGFKESSEKAKALWKAISSDMETRQTLAYTLESLLASMPPLYIGKADNLQVRLCNHFDEQSSSLLKTVRSAKIDLNDVYISFIEDPISGCLNDSISTALEEIIQRTTNPPLTKRYG